MLLIEVDPDSQFRVEVPTDSRVLVPDPVPVLEEEMPTIEPVLLIGVTEDPITLLLEVPCWTIPPDLEVPLCWTIPPDRLATSPAGLVGRP